MHLVEPPPALISIEDAGDPRLALFRARERVLSNRPQRRDDAGDGLFMAEGDLVVERALDAGCTPTAVLVDASRPPRIVDRLLGIVPVYAGGSEVRKLVTSLGVPSDVVALFHRPPRPSLTELAAAASHLVLVEAVDNPANIGAVVRNAAGTGWHGLVLDRTSADPLSRRALRVSMGHAASFPHARVVDVAAAVAELARAGFTVVALAPGGEVEMRALEPPDRLVLAVGAERSGLGADVLATADVRVRIEMAAGVDSLNVAAATAIACYALGPRR
jgi:tRNA G18 (ribose-2'-O)-methylase SpoU